MTELTEQQRRDRALREQQFIVAVAEPLKARTTSITLFAIFCFGAGAVSLLLGLLFPFIGKANPETIAPVVFVGFLLCAFFLIRIGCVLLQISGKCKEGYGKKDAQALLMTSQLLGKLFHLIAILAISVSVLMCICFLLALVS